MAPEKNAKHTSETKIVLCWIGTEPSQGEYPDVVR